MRRASGIRLKPQLPSLDALATSNPDEVPTEPGRRPRRDSSAAIDARVQVDLAKFQITETPEPLTVGGAGTVQKTFLAPNKRNSREPTDHDVQIISVYAPPPLPKDRASEALIFAEVDAYEVEVVLDDGHAASDAILETQVIPFVQEAAPSRLRRSLIAIGVLALSGAAGVAAYTSAPKLVQMLRLPASVATVSYASKPLPTPVARPTLTVATPAVPDDALAARDIVVTQGVEEAAPAPQVFAIVAGEAAPSAALPTDANEATATTAIGAGESTEASSDTAASAALLAPTALKLGTSSGDEASEAKAVSRAKQKRIRRLRARHKRLRARAKSAAAASLATPEK